MEAQFSDTISRVQPRVAARVVIFYTSLGINHRTGRHNHAKQNMMYTYAGKQRDGADGKENNL